MRALLRLIFFAVGSLFYIFIFLLKSVFGGSDFDWRLRMRMQWFKILSRALGVQIETFGELPQEAGLLVCNHRSYFDPIIVLTQLLALPVGKSEIRKWPIIGIGAELSGVVFVERKSKEGRAKARKKIVEILRQGYFVINYPEGTTHTQSQTIDFKPGMFKDASVEGFPVYPVALDYQSDEDAWVGEDTFLRHFFACFGKRKTNIRISYGTAIFSENPTELMQQSKDWIDHELLKIRKGWHFS